MGSCKRRFRRVLGGAIRTFNTQKKTLPSLISPANHTHPTLPSTSQMSLTQNTPPPYPNPRHRQTPSPTVSCHSPNLRAPTLRRGSRGEGSEVNCGSLGRNKLWWWVALPKRQQRRSEGTWWGWWLFITLTAAVTFNLSTAGHRKLIWHRP